MGDKQTLGDQPSSAQDYIVILGKPGTDPLTIVGPFVSMEYATAWQEANQKLHPDLAHMVDILTRPPLASGGRLQVVLGSGTGGGIVR